MNHTGTNVPLKMKDKNKGMIGPRIRAEREKLGLSQLAMAEHLGITARTQRNYEMGTRVPDAEYLISAAKIGVDLLNVLHGGFNWDAPNQVFESSSVLYIVEQTLGLKHEDVQHAAELAMLGKSPNDVSIYARDPEILLGELRRCSPVLQRIFDRETSLDTNLLAAILVAVDVALVDFCLPLTSIKKAQAVAMLYRAFKPSGRVEQAMIEETVKLASS